MFRVLQVTRTFDDCIDRTCNYGAAVDQQMMEVNMSHFSLLCSLSWNTTNESTDKLTRR